MSLYFLQCADRYKSRETRDSLPGVFFAQAAALERKASMVGTLQPRPLSHHHPRHNAVDAIEMPQQKSYCFERKHDITSLFSFGTDELLLLSGWVDRSETPRTDSSNCS